MYLIILISSLLLYGVVNGEVTGFTTTPDGKYDIYAKGAGWSLQFPKSDFKIVQHKQGTDGISNYYHFSNNNDLNVSFYIVQATSCSTSQECRKSQHDKPSESMKVSKYVKNYEMNGFAIIEYFLEKAGPKLTSQIPKLKDKVINQNHINAHYVKNGYRLDMHLSKMFFTEDDRLLFDDFIKSIEFVKR
jgi:hypothetical protein